MSAHKLNRIITSALSGIAMIALCAQAPAQTPVEPPCVINARVDSASVVMGARTTVHVEVLKNSHAGIYIDGMTSADHSNGVNMLNNVEVRRFSADSTDLGNGRIQVNYNYLIQPFDVGTATLGPFKYVAGDDTITSPTVSVKVLEPEIPEQLRDSLWINPMEGTVTIPAQWYDYIPEWWPWPLLGLAVLALVAVLLMLYKRNGPGLIVRKKVVPPHIVALKRLAALKQRRLAESNHVKEYYTELTDILRQYLEGRYGIYAREMTSSQILDAISEHQELNVYRPDLNELLRTADFVKFAKQNPGVNENIHSFSTVENFVEKTKPAEEEKDKAKDNAEVAAIPAENGTQQVTTSVTTSGGDNKNKDTNSGSLK